MITSTTVPLSSNDLADERTHLALTRTLVALDRTLMAWVRTATSLISFGFTIYKFFQTLHESQPSPVRPLIGSRGYAIVMIGLGIIALVAAIWQYRSQMKALHVTYARYAPFPRSISAPVASAVAGLGLLGLVIVLLRQ